MKKKKSDFASGLEHLMNATPMNPFDSHGSAVFRQMSQASGLPLATMLKYVGKKVKNPEQQRIETRLAGLEK